MRASKRYTVAVALMTGGLLTAFQNCGGVKFNPNASTVTSQSSVSGQGTITQTADPGGFTDLSMACEMPAAPRQVAAAAPVTISNVSNPPPVANADSVYANNVKAGDLIVLNANSLDASNLRGSLVAAAWVARVFDMQFGSVCLNTHHIADAQSLQNLKGPVRLSGTPDANGPATFDQVLNVRDLEITGFKGGLIQTTFGQLTLISSEVDTIFNHHGRIDLLKNSVVHHLVNSAQASVYVDGAPATADQLAAMTSN